jgi:flagellar biosynthesis protein FlhB
MSIADGEQDRSEPATPYKLARARERGVVARGLDIGYMAALAAFAGYVWFVGPDLVEALARASRGALVAAPMALSSPDSLLFVFGSVFSVVLRPLAFLIATIFTLVLLAELAQTGVVFSTEPLRPDFARLSPSRGFKRVFSLRMLIETVKNVLKLGVYVTLAWTVISAARGRVGSITDAPHLAGALRDEGFRLLALFLVAAVAFAILDQIISRQDFARRMRMSRRELRREQRDREGDPRLKQRRRALHREFVKLSQSLKNVRGADVLITNPMHYAVALKYDPATMVAPLVVSRGAHSFAQRLKRRAFIYGLVIVEAPELARTLFRRCELDQPVPEDCYRAVADVYLKVRKNRGRRGLASDV